MTPRLAATAITLAAAAGFAAGWWLADTIVEHIRIGAL